MSEPLADEPEEGLPTPEQVGLPEGTTLAEDLTLKRLGADEDEERIRAVREKGLDLVNQVFMALRTLMIHDPANQATRYPIEAMRGTLGELLDMLGTVHLIAVEEQAYINDIRIRVESHGYANVLFVVQTLGRHGVGGLTFASVPDEPQVRRMILLLIQHPPQDVDRLARLRELFAEDAIPVELDSPYFFASGDQGAAVERGTSAYAAFGYAKGLLAIKDYVRAIEAEGLANPLRIKKVVQDLVDISVEDYSDFLKLHVVHGAEDPLFNHSINVCALAIAVGKALGLGRVELADLGTAALLHDVGYAAVNDFDQAALQADPSLHPVAGARVLMRPYELTPSLVRRLRVVLEHHLHYARPGGYPDLPIGNMSVLSRLVAVADSYDALLTPAKGEPTPTPVKALERIVAGSGTLFDPVMVKALVRVLGRYPFGSLVKLSTGETGLVVSGGREGAQFARPRVRVVRDRSGQEVNADLVYDLSEKGHRFRRIVQILDPGREGVSIGHYLFQEEHAAEEAPPHAESTPPAGP